MKGYYMKWVLWLGFVLVSAITFAQSKNVTIVFEKENKNLVTNATCQILKIADSSILFSKILKPKTVFPLQVGNSYIVSITAVGFAKILQQITIIENDSVLYFKAIPQTKNLEAVVVTSKKPLITQVDDKTIVDAEPLANSSTNAYEVLEKTPGAILDQDGNVYLNGSTPAVIYINGREIRLSAQDLSTLLKSLPSSTISKIEILRSPSAKYDASSSGGIVNIVLKKGVKLGTNGSLDASYFQGKYATGTFGFNIYKNNNKTNTYFTYNITNRNNFQILQSERLNAPNNTILFTQDLYTKFKTTTNFASGGIDYKINEKWNINYDARITANNSRNNVTNDVDIFTTTNNRLGENASIISNVDPTFLFANSVNLKNKIDSLGSEFTSTVEYNHFNLNNEQNYANLNILPRRNTLFGDGDISNKKDMFVLKSDVVIKTKPKITVEFGAKYNYTKSNNNALFFADTSTGKYLNTFQTNKFKYTESIAAVYLTLSKTIKGFTIKPGLRFEHTDIIGNQIIPTDTTFKIQRNNIFPYVFIKKKIAKLMGFQLTGNLIFRKSITRPFYEALNPTPRFVDQYTYDIGNPNLKPQFTNNYEFNISANEFPVFSVGMNDVRNIFTALTYQVDNILYRTYDNLGSNKEYYFRIVGGIPPGKGKYSFYAGTQMNSLNFRGIYNGENFKYSRTSWNVFMFHSYKATPTLNLTVNGWMRLNGVFNFFEIEDFGTLNFSANKSFFKKKMNVIISANDILKTNRQQFNVDVPRFIANGLQYNDVRRVGIALRYSFGLKPKPEPAQRFGAVPQDTN
jgi:iron complex outermembrane recepter protein